MIFSLLIMSIGFTAFCILHEEIPPKKQIVLKIPIIPVVVDLIEDDGAEYFIKQREMAEYEKYHYVPDPEEIDPPTMIMPRKQK